MSKLLINDNPIKIIPSLALKLGYYKAVILPTGALLAYVQQALDRGEEMGL